MTTFDEILDEELGIMDESDKARLKDIRRLVNRAAERYANQQTRYLEAKILTYRRELVGEPDSYDKHFGITTQRYGRVL